MNKSVALVTGASRGLGAELAKILSSTHHVVAVSRTIGALEALDDQIKKCGGSSTLAPIDLTDEKVWSKAVKDSVGLNEFYEKNKSNYMWKQRAEATLFICSDATVAKNVSKLLSKRGKKAYTNEDLLKMVNVDSQLALKIEEGKFAKGANENVDKAKWEKLPAGYVTYQRKAKTHELPLLK